MTRLLHMALLLVMGATWGLQFSMLKLAAEAGLSEIEIIFVAMLAVALFFTVLSRVRGRGFRWTRERTIFLVITGATGYVLPLGAALVAAPHVPAGLLTFIASLTPLVTVVCALAVRAEAVSLRRMAALALGMAAAAFVIVPELAVPDLGLLPWLAIAALVPLNYGIETVYVAARWPDGLDVLQVVTGEAIVAFVMMVPLFLVFADMDRLGLLWTEGGIGVLFFVIGGLVEAMLYFYLVQNAGAVFTSFGTFVSLFAGIGWGMAIFGERHGLLVWIAVALLVAALAIETYERKAPRT